MGKPVIIEHLHDASRYTVWGRYFDSFEPAGTTLLIRHGRVLVHVTDGTKRAYNMFPRLRDVH